MPAVKAKIDKNLEKLVNIVIVIANSKLNLKQLECLGLHFVTCITLNYFVYLLLLLLQ